MLYQWATQASLRDSQWATQASPLLSTPHPPLRDSRQPGSRFVVDADKLLVSIVAYYTQCSIMKSQMTYNTLSRSHNRLTEAGRRRKYDD